MASIRVGGFNVLTTALSTEASCHHRGLLPSDTLSDTLADAAAGRAVLLVHHHRLEVRRQHAVLPPAPSIQSPHEHSRRRQFIKLSFGLSK
jgi:hypothetical protein